MNKLELCHADTCLPDYWAGRQRAYLQIPVFAGMTMKEIKQALKDEISQGAVMGSEHLAYLLSSECVKPEEEKEADAATRAAYAAINRLKLGTKRQQKFLLGLAKDNFDCYAYFVFMPLE